MRGRRTLAVLLEPAPVILLAATVAHIVRRNVFDIVVFSAVVVVIVLDRARRGRNGSARSRPLPAAPWWAVAASAVLFGLVLGSSAPGSLPPRITLAAIGLVTLVLVAAGLSQQPREASGQGPNRSWIAWAGVLVLAALLELWNFAHQPDPQTDSYTHPTISALIGPELASWPVRTVVLAGWIAGLWWLVRACRAGGTTSPEPGLPDG
jgi:hypothetical protein